MQEFYGFVTSKQISDGVAPPPQRVTIFISLLCTSLALFTYLSKGKATAALSVATFAVLSLQLITSEKIGMSDLAVTVLGLFYCGEFWSSCPFSACFQEVPPWRCAEWVSGTYQRLGEGIFLEQLHSMAYPKKDGSFHLELRGCFVQATSPRIG